MTKKQVILLTAVIFLITNLQYLPVWVYAPSLREVHAFLQISVLLCIVMFIPYELCMLIVYRFIKRSQLRYKAQLRNVLLVALYMPLLLVLSAFAGVFLLGDISMKRTIRYAGALIADVELYKQIYGQYPLEIDETKYSTGVFGTDLYRYRRDGAGYKLYFVQCDLFELSSRLVEYVPLGAKSTSCPLPLVERYEDWNYYYKY